MRDMTGDAPTFVEVVQARAALAGNPSDGYGGAVLAVPVDAYAATSTLRPAAVWTIGDELSGRRTFETWHDLAHAIESVRADASHALVLAAIGAYTTSVGQPPPPSSIEVSTTIPLAVGLAGSSAIVIGVLRALYRAAGRTMPHPRTIAAIALGAESSRLGITAGMQDRLVQAYGRPLLMRFDSPGDVDGQTLLRDAPGTVHGVEPGADFGFLVAHRAGLSEPSHVVHGDLRRRFDAGDRTVHSAMSRLFAHAGAARDALNAGDPIRLGEAMDATFDLRAEMIELHAGHVEMIEAARAAGASANYTGSGGSVVVSSRDADIERRAAQSLKSLGCAVVSVEIGPGTTWPPLPPPDPSG